MLNSRGENTSRFPRYNVTGKRVLQTRKTELLYESLDVVSIWLICCYINMRNDYFMIIS